MRESMGGSEGERPAERSKFLVKVLRSHPTSQLVCVCVCVCVCVRACVRACVLIGGV